MGYLCDKCDYYAITAVSLKLHLESFHDGVRYPCDKCEYKATSCGSLKFHKASILEIPVVHFTIFGKRKHTNPALT